MILIIIALFVLWLLDACKHLEELTVATVNFHDLKCPYWAFSDSIVHVVLYTVAACECTRTA